MDERITVYDKEFREFQNKHGLSNHEWFGKREELVEKYSWAVPNADAVDEITGNYEYIYEVGAGTGYWAHCIEQGGTKVHAYDKDPDSSWQVNIEERSAKHISAKISDEPVLMVWPPVNDPMAATVAKARPSHIVYVGEKRGGCTADDDFFEELDTHYVLIRTVEIPSYEGVNDNLYHYVRKD